jgi:hypothetical protein
MGLTMLFYLKYRRPEGYKENTGNNYEWKGISENTDLD